MYDLFMFYLGFSIIFSGVAFILLIVGVICYEGEYEFEDQWVKRSLYGIPIAWLWPLVIPVVFVLFVIKAVDVVKEVYHVD